MANEATVSCSLKVRKSSGTVVLIDYQGRPTSFLADVSGSYGPVGGSIEVTENGTDIDLSGVDSPGLCRLSNQDESNYIRVGIWNPDQSEFYPFLKLLPGESYVIRLDDLINEEFSGTGTGTTGQFNTLRAKAENSPARLLVELFPN